MQRAPGALFVVLEGGDGAGKSTQAALLARRLQDGGREVVRTREPGGTVIGEELRSLVLEHDRGEVDARTEALMFAAARAAHVQQLILPALGRGATIICDRFIDSSVAYQGVGRGLGADEVLRLNRWATDGLRPDLTILLDVDPLAGRQRRTQGHGAEDRLESEPDDFHTRIRRAFLERARNDDGAYVVLDASLEVEDLAARIATAVDTALQAAGASS
ncbi:dTMP kinase [Arthrobacter sp. 179]|uniref:dTMP kinase n=1 Tax=Arthrobacter sp. 179 TaxID=3457734 RepID=UPI004033FB7F